MANGNELFPFIFSTPIWGKPYNVFRLDMYIYIYFYRLAIFNINPISIV